MMIRLFRFGELILICLNIILGRDQFPYPSPIVHYLVPCPSSLYPGPDPSPSLLSWSLS